MGMLQRLDRPMDLERELGSFTLGFATGWLSCLVKV